MGADAGGLGGFIQREMDGVRANLLLSEEEAAHVPPRQVGPEVPEHEVGMGELVVSAHLEYCFVCLDFIRHHPPAGGKKRRL